MPNASPAAPGAPLTAARAPVARLVIIERLALFCPAVAPDERSLPPAECSAEAVEAARQLAHGGYHLAIASQHPAVARGLLDMATVNAQNRRLLRQLDEAGARIEAIAICPHGPEAGCGCRMPRPGMLTGLIARFGAAVEATAVIATTREAVEAGLAAGCRTLQVGGTMEAGKAEANKAEAGKAEAGKAEVDKAAVDKGEGGLAEAGRYEAVTSLAEAVLRLLPVASVENEAAPAAA